MRISTLPLVGISLLAASATALFIPDTIVTRRAANAEPASAEDAAPILHPIHPDAFESAAGLHVRATTDFSRLDPKEQAHLVYGSPGNNGNIMLANMTLHAPDGKLIVMMESFEGLTSTVDCQGDDGQLSVTFEDQEAFNYALSKWSFIHEEAELDFILITNHDGCGPDNERQAYLVNDIDNDEEKFIVKMASTEVEWKEITGTFEMDFGKAVLSPGALKKLRVRGWWDDVVDGVTDVVDDVKDGVTDVVDDVKDGLSDLTKIDLSEQVDFDIGIGEEKHVYNIIDVNMIKMDCQNCFVRGTFKIAGRVRTELFDLKELSLSVTPQDFKAALEVKTTLNIAKGSPTNDATKYTETKDVGLIEAPVPGAGLVVPGIFTLGAIVGIDAGFEMTFRTGFSFTLGLNAEIPNTANLLIDLANMDATGASGWEGATLTPVVEFDAKNVTIEGSIFMRPKVALKAEITALGKAEAQINLDLPKITASATLKQEETDGAGACPDSDLEFAVNLNLKGKLGVNVGVSGEIAGWGTGITKPLVTLDLFSQDWCFPFANPFEDEQPTIDPPAPSDTAAPAPVDTAAPAPVDTAAPAPVDTAVPANATSIPAGVFPPGSVPTGTAPVILPSGGTGVVVSPSEPPATIPSGIFPPGSVPTGTGPSAPIGTGIVPADDDSPVSVGTGVIIGTGVSVGASIPTSAPVGAPYGNYTQPALTPSEPVSDDVVVAPADVESPASASSALVSSSSAPASPASSTPAAAPQYIPIPVGVVPMNVPKDADSDAPVVIDVGGKDYVLHTPGRHQHEAKPGVVERPGHSSGSVEDKPNKSKTGSGSGSGSGYGGSTPTVVTGDDSELTASSPAVPLSTGTGVPMQLNATANYTSTPYYRRRAIRSTRLYRK